MAVNGGQAAVFVDKDGTLVENVPYNVDPAAIRLTIGAASALRRLHDAGYRVVIVSNQSGVARGYFDEGALQPVIARVEALLSEAGVPLAGFYYCPHLPGGAVSRYAIDCMCRKPEPGLIELAAEELRLDVSSSWCVGDILDDVEAGRRAGCRTILVDNGNETEWQTSPWRRPDVIVRSLAEAAERILEQAHGAAAAVPAERGAA